MYEDQVKNEEFKELSSLKKSYYFLLQSMANKFGEFYYRDTNFAAALDCSDEAIKKARREFVKKGWITIIPGRRDKHGRGIATQYTFVKWSKPPQKDDGKRFAPIQRYTLEMILNNGLSADCIVTYIVLTYWKHFHELEDGAFFITKTQLKELTGLKGMNKIDNCLEELYNSIHYSGGSHLFEFADQYHKYKFSKWATPAEPSDDETNRKNQKRFWDNVVKQGQLLQEKRQTKEKDRQLKELSAVYEYFKQRYQDYYGIMPNPSDNQIKELLLQSRVIGELDMRYAVNHYFTEQTIKGVSSSQRRTLKKFLDLKLWENNTSVK